MALTRREEAVDEIKRLKRGIMTVTILGEASLHAAHTSPRRGLLTALERRGYSTNERWVLCALWQLVAEGLMFIDFTRGNEHPTNWSDSPEFWIWVLTNRGERLARAAAEDVEPDDPEGYLTLLQKRVPDLDAQVLTYLGEALRAYGSGCHTASTVMLGVASERAFQLLGEAFKKWLPQKESEAFAETFDNVKRNYINKFEEFRRRIEPKKGQIPPEFSDNMALNLDSIADMLRVDRNDAGHPTGRVFDADEAYINLQVFARYVVKMDGLRRFFAK
ncbi:MAG: hypothetical protein QOH21_2399 [Acidobacteriota bacterium]|jgi:hypothetical protein|nr:hypothetical protein [Acidobacteriota bacterium]